MRTGLRCLPALALLLLALAACAVEHGPQPAGLFLVKPYIQLGDAPRPASEESLTVLWHTADRDADWTVELRPAGTAAWRAVESPTARRVAVPGIPPHRVYRAALRGLPPGAVIEYRLRVGGETVFQAKTRARVPAEQPHRFAVFGDCGIDSGPQRAVASQTLRQKPDFVFITGDMVYGRGRISEYRTNYFPIYNADVDDPKVGAPLLRSTLTLACPGNHDIGNRDLDRYSDGLAYFFYWAQPLNGPLAQPGQASTPTLEGAAANRAAFKQAAGENYPRMANFSFDYGGAHWTVLDANGYVDWTDPALRAWVERDLKAARNAAWRFVAFHQPGFHSSRGHFGEQQMRLMADVFERGKVDIVFNGHVHNYQRTYPMRFAVNPEVWKARRRSGQIEGRWTLDRAFDGKTRTEANGVIYIVTGAGGARLYNPEQENPATWQEFTARYLAKFSLTVVDVDGRKLTVRQVGADGKELDRFTLTKPRE
jgi:hypothetical protein